MDGDGVQARPLVAFALLSGVAAMMVVNGLTRAPRVVHEPGAAASQVANVTSGDVLFGQTLRPAGPSLAAPVVIARTTRGTGGEQPVLVVHPIARPGVAQAIHAAPTPAPVSTTPAPAPAPAPAPTPQPVRPGKGKGKAKAKATAHSASARPHGQVAPARQKPSHRH